MNNLEGIKHIFFVGVAGTGMSALAQYAAGIGFTVSGSDRFFNNSTPNETQEKLEQWGIQCFLQDASGITTQTQLVVISTAVEDTNIEVQKAHELGIPLIKRSDLLAIFCNQKNTIAVAGTSGKSTTSAMVYDILDFAGLSPSIISGAGLVRLQEKGLIGNAAVGKSDWLVIEADESDGSIVKYWSEIGLLLNIDKDHKEIHELLPLFEQFKQQSKRFITNQHNTLAATFSSNLQQDFGADKNVGFSIDNFIQQGFTAQFTINYVPFSMNSIGYHNAENALAATAVAVQLGLSLETCAAALKNYKGIYRRNQVLGEKSGVLVVDDYAHNPAKVAAAIRGVQPLQSKVIAWFQPHGYGPTRFLRADFVQEIAQALRPTDEIWMSEIYYAGGTAVKDISAGDLIADLQAKGAKAVFVPEKAALVKVLKQQVQAPYVLLLMGARDPNLAEFAASVFEEL
ncbi:MAG: UDP-N-acetylmuramate--alanine ligase [Bacteroidetes bacterium]|nr:MAG: UDP-N-acetylmuramate--alanine ligase [Bacteroidota bacterium]